jgi:hypothetical protein
VLGREIHAGDVGRIDADAVEGRIDADAVETLEILKSRVALPGLSGEA